MDSDDGGVVEVSTYSYSKPRGFGVMAPGTAYRFCCYEIWVENFGLDKLRSPSLVTPCLSTFRPSHFDSQRLRVIRRSRIYLVTQ